MQKLLDLTSYDVVFTTSFEAMHGLSGHLYEQIEYHYISLINGYKSAILLSDGTTLAMLMQAISDKYTFTLEELNLILDNVIEAPQPKLIRANNVCIVDGAEEIHNCILYCKNLILLRCSNNTFTNFIDYKTINRVHLLQDFLVYPERFEDHNMEVVDYVKKILWTKYKQPDTVTTNTALMYLTTNCRALPAEEIQSVIDSRSYDKYLIVTNNPAVYKSLESDTVSVEKGPIPDIFNRFDAYIYTATPKKADCSPRFIVECEVFGKEVDYEIDYIDPGIEARKQHMLKDINSLRLDKDDAFIKYLEKLS